MRTAIDGGAQSGARIRLVKHLAAAARARPSPEDEAELRLYFDEGVDFFAAQSTFGRQLELADHYFGELRPCRGCGGRDAAQVDEEWVTEQGGSGFMVSGREWAQRRTLALILGEDLAIPGDITCTKCDGRGWIRRAARKRKPTVQMTGSSVVGSTLEPGGNLERMAKFGKVDRILSRVSRRDPVLWRTLAAYYAPGGSLGAVWVLTDQGRALFGDRMNKGLNEAQYFRILVDLHLKQKTPEREAEFRACDLQAQNLLEAAWQMYATLK